MKPSVFKKNPKSRETIDLSEAHGITRLLETRYDNVRAIQVLKNFAHDRDLSLAVTRLMDAYQDQARALEREAVRFRLKLPSKPPKDVKTSHELDIISDEFVYRTVVRDVQGDVFVLSRTVRTTTTNDRLRKLLCDFLRTQLGNLDVFIRYGKAKGWQETAPTFKTGRAVDTEQLSVAEAYHLWEHISLRYDQIELTQLFAPFAHDPEFKAIVDIGLTILRRQAQRLEELLLKQEIPPPPRPPESMRTPVDPESLEDRFIYRTIFRGIQDAVDLHLRAVVESTRNEDLRQIFSSFLFEELDLFDRFLRYGKMKGWTQPPPAYSEPAG